MLKNAYYAITDWFLDTKTGLAVIAAVCLAFVGFGLPAILNAVADQNASGYTGTATVNSHRIVGSLCYVDLMHGDGVSEKNKVFGPKMTCYSVDDNSEVNLVNGRFKK